MRTLFFLRLCLQRCWLVFRIFLFLKNTKQTTPQLLLACPKKRVYIIPGPLFVELNNNSKEKKSILVVVRKI